MGNHDRHANAAQTQEVLAQSNVIELSNEVFTLERDGQLLTIAGVDDAWYHHDRLDLVLEKLPDEGGAVLLMHEPDFADSSAPTGRFDLQLSGHSHGGQIVLGSGPLVLPDLGKKYHTGQYQLDDMILYTNRGVGVTIPPVRINCPAEISVFTLHPAI
jgi:predicted MPP superfamily phosphohydrolase